jgi:signal transduction histidine kinase
MGAIRGKHETISSESLLDGLPSLVVAAHELKSPLALIRQLSLTLENGDISSDDQKRMLRQISLTTERALRLTNDLTRSIRMTDAMFTLEPINPQQLCEDVVHELTPLFSAHERQVKLVSHKHSLLLVANRDLLRRIILNFSDNALNYTEDNKPVEIDIRTYNSGKMVRLGVRDYGPTLSSDLFRSLRQKLVNVSSTPIHARPQSSGLGLYIVSQFADVMNGKVGMTRHHNGATFYVDLQASRQISLL